MKQSDLKKWHGFDASNEISLMDYGLLIRKANKNCYEVIIKYCDERPLFEKNFFYFKEWFNSLKETANTENFPSLKLIAEMEGIDSNDYINYYLKDESRMEIVIYDLITYYGITNIFPHEGKSYNEGEIRRKLNKAL